MAFKPDYQYISTISHERVVHANAMLTQAHHYRENRDYPAARDLYQAVVSIVPNDKMVWTYLGECWLNLSRADRALPCYKQALACDPGFVPALIQLADCSNFRKMPKKALKILTRAEGLIDDSVASNCMLWTSRGNAYFTMNDFEKAEKAYLKAVEIRPDYHAPHGNLGNIYGAWHQWDKAREHYTKAYLMGKDPTMALNMGILNLLLGEYPKGWEWYKKRLEDTRHVEFNRFSRWPVWKGEQTDTLYICGEQGLGDFIHCARYFKEAKKRCKKLIVETQKPWAEIAQCFEGPDEIVIYKDNMTLERDFTAWCPLFSLPVALGMPYPKDAPPAPYLEISTAEPKKRPAIAIFWQGNPDHPNDKQRSIPLETLAPIVRSYPEAYWFTCHPEKQALEDIKRTGLPIEQLKGSLMDSAKILGEADLVISIDTGPVHISGAMGIPTWILLPPNPDWRWGLESALTSWYSNTMLYRGNTRRIWSDIIPKVIADLQRFKHEHETESQEPPLSEPFPVRATGHA